MCFVNSCQEKLGENIDMEMALIAELRELDIKNLSNEATKTALRADENLRTLK